ncbi:retinoblastoma-associated protein B domain containing protein [Nitzschia inconspicua]|uniref:Retinoblastoma-associated protein B domain containing protein n=1 Tax=Nitzschia inconspicua TaxID=303405 RepID=A0A9K3PMK7_9STRA|nr:retinoblastoma-associated protein B domain containing protein [Nitzschia inconspicua]
MSGPESTESLLGYMKLREDNDPFVYQKIEEWVLAQKISNNLPAAQQIPCNKAAALLVCRFARAFQQRLSPPGSHENKDKTTQRTDATALASETAITTSAPVPEDKTTPIVEKNSTTTPSSITSPKQTSNETAVSSPTENTAKLTDSNNSVPKPATPAKTPNLKSLMQRRVKVTKNVQLAVQFIGSDLLKVLQVQKYAPTIVDVVDFNLLLLANEEKIQEIYGIFLAAIGDKLEGSDPSTSVFFGVFALQSLQALRSQSIAMFELAYDFDYIYETCHQTESFARCVNTLNPTLPPPPPSIIVPQFAPDTEARNICWKLARLLALKDDNVSSKTDPDGKRRRRNHVITSAASILFAASLGQAKLELSKPAEASVHATAPNSVEPPAKKQKTDEKGPIDFVDLASLATTDLGYFIARNSYNNPDFTSITTAEIRSQLFKIYGAIDKLKTVRDYEKGESTFNGNEASNASIFACFPRDKVHFFLQNYRTIIHELESEAQMNLQINPDVTVKTTSQTDEKKTQVTVRMAIANVMMMFPMVLGEPWGIHRDASKITCKLLCKGEGKKPLLQQAASVAVVLECTYKKSNAKPTRSHGTSDVIMDPTGTHGSLDAIVVDPPPQEPPPPPRPPVLLKIGDIEPPIISDSMELNEWTLSILSLSVVKPSDSLLMYLGETDRSLGDGSSCLHDVIVPVLNRGLLRVQGALRSTTSGSMSSDTRLTVGRKDGQVYVSGQIDEATQLCASVVGFYYHSLEAIIIDQMERMEFLGSFGSLLRSESFHRALLACCYACTLKGAGTTQKLRMNGSHKDTTVHLLMETIESSPYTFLKVTEALRRALVVTSDPSKKKLGSPIVPGLPVVLQKHLQKLEVQLVDSIVWATSSSSRSEGSLATTIKTMKGLPGAWPPDVLEATLPEELADSQDVSSILIDEKYKPPFCASTEANFLSYVLRKLLKISFFRIQAICAALKLSRETQIQTQVLVAFRYLLRHHFDLFYDRHIDQLILCTIYGVCRVIGVQPEVTFGKLMDAYIVVRTNDQGERACRVILRHVKLVSNENDHRPEGKVVGNLIVFYNQVYVPRMQKHFTMSTSLKASSAEYRKRHPLQRRNGSSSVAQSKSDATSDITMVGNTATNGHTEAIQENSGEKKTANPTIASKAATTDTQKGDGSAAAEIIAIQGEKEEFTEDAKDNRSDAIVVARIDDGKDVIVVEKASIDSAKPTENGTQKRTFSSMGGPKYHLN